jgi:hypothetical protein
MIQFQLQPEIEARLAAEAQARSLALDHYIEMIVRSCTVEQVRQRSVAEASTVFGNFAMGTNSVALRSKI